MQATPSGAEMEPRNRSYILVMLLLVYTFNFIDRSIINTLGEAIKQDLRLSDFQLGLLGGLSFALFYTVLGIPIAWLSDRYNRTWIIAISLTVWSGMTIACGLAANFLQLLAARVGVGVGEAGGTPGAHSIISDLYGTGQRSKAMAIYALGIPIGVMFGALAGGWITQEYGWRMAFFLVGAPGLILALAFKLTVREPKRHAADGQTHIPVGAVFQSLLKKKSFKHVVSGIALMSFTGYSFMQFLHPLLVRNYNVSYADAALFVALIGGAAAGLGTYAGGIAAQTLSKRDIRFQMLIPGFVCLLAAPFYIMALLQASLIAAVALLALANFLQSALAAPAFASIQDIAPAKTRATSAALMLLIVNLAGLGLGPMAVGALSDVFTRGNFNPPLMFDGLDFATACANRVIPGLEQACKQASASGLQQSLLVIIAIYPWAAFHFLRAAKTLRQDASVSAQATL